MNTDHAKALAETVAGIDAAPRPLWLTRDSDPVTGAVEDTVEVWLGMPERFPVSITEEVARRIGITPKIAHTWLMSEFDVDGRIAQIPIGLARAMFGTVPDNDREMVRID